MLLVGPRDHVSVMGNPEFPVNRGGLCVKGWAAASTLTHAERLLSEGRAYRCYCTPEELDARREAAQARGETFRYDGRCRDVAPRPGVLAALRLRIPDSGTTVVPPLVIFAPSQFAGLGAPATL